MCGIRFIGSRKYICIITVKRSFRESNSPLTQIPEIKYANKKLWSNFSFISFEDVPDFPYIGFVLYVLPLRREYGCMFALPPLIFPFVYYIFYVATLNDCFTLICALWIQQYIWVMFACAWICLYGRGWTGWMYDSQFHSHTSYLFSSSYNSFESLEINTFLEDGKNRIHTLTRKP